MDITGLRLGVSQDLSTRMDGADVCSLFLRLSGKVASLNVHRVIRGKLLPNHSECEREPPSQEM